MKKENKIKVEYEKGRGLREKLVLWILEKGAPLHYHLCNSRMAWNLNSDDLILFPPKSLGHTLGCFYKTNGFEPVPKAERHDVFHVLLGYSTDVIDEAAMQFFLLGNGKISPFTLGTVVICTIFFPFQWKVFRDAFIKGKQATCISEWDFKLLLTEETEKLKRQILKQ